MDLKNKFSKIKKQPVAKKAKFSFSSSEDDDDEEENCVLNEIDTIKSTEKTSKSSNNYCQYCLNCSIVTYRINFNEAIRICSNLKCSQFDTDLNVENLITNSSSYFNETPKYTNELKSLSVDDLENKLENLNDLKCLNDLNFFFEKLISKEVKRLSKECPSNAFIENSTDMLEKSNIFDAQIDTQPINENNNFHLLTDAFNQQNQPTYFYNQPVQSYQNTNLFENQQQYADIDIFTPLPDEILPNQITCYNQSTLPQYSNSNNLFDENLFSTVDKFLNDEWIYDVNNYNPILNNNNNNNTANQIQVPVEQMEYCFEEENKQLTELSATNIADLSSKFTPCFYSDDFLNANNVNTSFSESSNNLKEETFEIKTNKCELVSDIKTKSGSSIKITKLNKNVLKLSPTSSPKRELKLPTQLSPSSSSISTIDLDCFKSIETNSEIKTSFNSQKTSKVKSDFSTENLLPWEVKTKRKPRKQIEKIDSNEIKSSPKPSSSLPKQTVLVTKADLSQKTSEQKLDFKERGTLLKKSILEDSLFQSKLTKNDSSLNVASPKSGASNTSYKDLVLSVLKKKTPV